MNEELRDYIEQNRIKTSPVYLQRFHATPPTGWINDPNGFIWFKGRYHLFGQFYPYGSQWGTMHWGHWVSDDLVAWNWSGVALIPDTDADRDGCFPERQSSWTTNWSCCIQASKNRPMVSTFSSSALHGASTVFILQSAFIIP